MAIPMLALQAFLLPLLPSFEGYGAVVVFGGMAVLGNLALAWGTFESLRHRKPKAEPRVRRRLRAEWA